MRTSSRAGQREDHHHLQLASATLCPDHNFTTYRHQGAVGAACDTLRVDRSHFGAAMIQMMRIVALLAGGAAAAADVAEPDPPPAGGVAEARAGRHFFVRGESSAAATASGPSFRFLAEAVAAVRSLPQEQRCGATVTIAGGVYTGDANAFRLTAEDSGCAGDPVVYRADPADPEPVVLHGGAPIPASAFRQEDAKTPN